MKNLIKIALKDTLILYIFVIIIDSIFYTFSFTFVGLVKRDIFNKLQGQNTLFGQPIWMLVILAALTPLIINAIKQCNSYIVAKVQQNINCNLKLYLFRILINKKINRNQSKDNGNIIVCFREDINDIVSFFYDIYIQMPKLLLSIVALIILFKINLLYSLISVVPLLCIIFAIHAIQKKLINNRYEMRCAVDQSTIYLLNIFESIENIKMSKNKTAIIKKYHRLSEERAKKSIKDFTLQKVLEIFASNFMYIALAVVLLIACYEMNSNTFSVGDFVLYEYYFWFLSDLPTVFSSVLSKYRQMAVSIGRIQKLSEEDFMDICSNIYVNRKKENIYTDNPIVAVCGENGVGKSILLKDFFEHEISRWNNDICTLLDEQYLMKKNIVYISQNPILFEGTILENICMGEEQNNNLLKKVIRISALENDIDKGKLNLNDVVDSMGKNLSGGEIKRIALARALYQNPDALLLDDITSGLDLRTEKNVLMNFRQLNIPIFIATSSEKVIRSSDIVIRMEKRGKSYA